jgi:Ca2+-binding EF-hand superfamily protein
MNELREGQREQRATLQNLTGLQFLQVEEKPKKLGLSREPTIQSDDKPEAGPLLELGLKLKLPEGLRQEEPPKEEPEFEPVSKKEDKAPKVKPPKSEFELIVKMSKKFQMTIAQVKSEYAEFNRHDTDGSGLLDKNEFLDRLRIAIKIPPGGKLPKHLINKEWAEADVDGDGAIDFEEYLAWAQNVAFSRELHCKNQLEAELRELSTKHNVPLPDIEHIRKAFDRFDEDSSGVIDKEEFKCVLLMLLKAKDASDLPPDRLERYWKEVDEDHSGSIEFEEFLLWYLKYFFVAAGDGSSGRPDPTTQAYAKLGAQRLRPIFGS